MMYKALKWTIKTGLYAYHKKIKVQGLEHIPQNGPVLFLPNHQSALIDVLLIAVHCRRKPYFLTRSDVFGKPVLNAFFKFLRMLPVYRIRDGRSTLSKNNAIFERCAHLLTKGEAIVLFPEANHNLKRQVRPLSKGFTRVLIRAMAKEPHLDIQLIPVGLNYRHAVAFPDEVAIYFGKPISVLGVYDGYDEQKSVQGLKDAIMHSLKKLTTHINDGDHYTQINEELELSGVDLLCPDATNAWVRQWLPNGEAHAGTRPVAGKKRFFYRILCWVNLPVVLVWRYVVKPKVCEPEFTGTFRFATAMGGFLVYLPLLFMILFWIAGPVMALITVWGVMGYNWLYVKWPG